MGACSSLLTYNPARADGAKGTTQQSGPAGVDRLVVTVGKSMIIDSPLPILRVSVANELLAETVAVDPKQVLINGKAPGETSLIVWQRDGARMVYDLTVRMSPLKLDAVRQQIARDFPKEDINITFENDTAFVRGTVKDVVSAERVMTMAATLGKAVNLLRVEVPPVEAQVLLHVKFASVDRSTAFNLSLGLASGSFNTVGALGTGGPVVTPNQTTTPYGTLSAALSSAMNIFLYNKNINLLAGLQALQTKGLAEVLAEPNVLAINGQEASFVAGGQFPFPMVQGGSAVGAITISWKEYGIRLNFLPDVTPRGTIRLKVGAGGERARLLQCGDHFGLHGARSDDPPRADRSGAGKRPELCDRRPAGQPDDREPLEDSGDRRHSAAGQAVPGQDDDQEQHRAVGDCDSRTGAPHSAGSAATVAEYDGSLPDHQHQRADAAAGPAADRAGAGEAGRPKPCRPRS